VAANSSLFGVSAGATASARAGRSVTAGGSAGLVPALAHHVPRRSGTRYGRRGAEIYGSTGTASGNGPPSQVSDDQPEVTRMLPCFGQTTATGMSGVPQPNGQPQFTMSRYAGHPGGMTRETCATGGTRGWGTGNQLDIEREGVVVTAGERRAGVAATKRSAKPPSTSKRSGPDRLGVTWLLTDAGASS